MSPSLQLGFHHRGQFPRDVSAAGLSFVQFDVAEAVHAKVAFIGQAVIPQQERDPGDQFVGHIESFGQGLIGVGPAQSAEPQAASGEVGLFQVGRVTGRFRDWHGVQQGVEVTAEEGCEHRLCHGKVGGQEYRTLPVQKLGQPDVQDDGQGQRVGECHVGPVTRLDRGDLAPPDGHAGLGEESGDLVLGEAGLFP